MLCLLYGGIQHSNTYKPWPTTTAGAVREQRSANLRWPA